MQSGTPTLHHAYANPFTQFQAPSPQVFNGCIQQDGATPLPIFMDPEQNEQKVQKMQEAQKAQKAQKVQRAGELGQN